MTGWQGPAPEGLTYVVGDIHGCAEQLGGLLEKIDDDVAASGGAAQVVFVGDYVDRGEDSADVLRFVAAATSEHPDRLIALAGNHEEMLLAFLDDPAGKGRRWLRYGGLQTLASFGVAGSLSAETRSAAQLLDAAGDLQDALGQDMIKWLKTLPVTWSSGTLSVVHAAADPAKPIGGQDRKTLLWGHEAFLHTDRSDGQWVAFGHQPFEEPFAQDGRIAVDTGAVYGGSLTAARVDPDGTISFLSA